MATMLKERASDSSLVKSVTDQLAWTPQVTSNEIGVGVHEGVVTLTGHVKTYAEKLAAERAAQALYGVRAVANELEVRPTDRISDTDLARDAVHALDRRVDVPAGIKVTVKEGWLTLSGTVDRWYERKAAESAVKYLTGVRGVSNDVSLRPRASTSDVKRLIEDALRRNAELDARRIGVDARDGTVTLRGNVSSWAEKRQAEWAAWASPGVSRVDNQIVIVP